MIDNYIRQLLKKYRQRDRERQEQLSEEHGRPISLPMSDEVYLLQKYRWLILSNQSNIKYEDYTISRYALEEAESLCHGNWIEIQNQYEYIKLLQTILEDNGISYPDGP